MKLLRFLLFFLTFSAEVHLRAEVQSLPNNCWLRKQTPCTIKNAQKKFTSFHWHGTSFNLAPMTIILVEGTSQLRLLEGSLWVEAKKEATQINTAYGTLNLRAGSLCWLDRKDKNILVRTHRGLASVELKGEERKFEVPEAFETTLTPVDRSARAQFQTITALDYPDHLRHMKFQFPKKSTYTHEVEEFAPKWKTALEQAASLHLSLAEREVAAASNAHHSAIEQRKKVQAEKAAYRQMLLEQAER